MVMFTWKTLHMIICNTKLEQTFLLGRFEFMFWPRAWLSWGISQLSSVLPGSCLNYALTPSMSIPVHLVLYSNCIGKHVQWIIKYQNGSCLAWVVKVELDCSLFLPSLLQNAGSDSYWQLLWYKIELLLVVLKIEVFWDVTLCYMGK